ncbi:MAG: hypothetical protein ABMB14_33330 [Myxococcota bacterium]
MNRNVRAFEIGIVDVMLALSVFQFLLMGAWFATNWVVSAVLR